jgi:hypothetical protein
MNFFLSLIRILNFTRFGMKKLLLAFLGLSYAFSVTSYQEKGGLSSNRVYLSKRNTELQEATRSYANRGRDKGSTSARRW